MLGVPDLVPLFSWLCLRGRCRYCGAKIPAESFWAELVSGIACCLIVYRFDVSVLALRGILLWIVLLCLTLTDLHAWIIPDRLQVAGVLIFFGTAVCLPETGAQILRGVLTGAGLSGGMLALSLLFDRLTGGIVFSDSQLCACNRMFVDLEKGENPIWTGDCGSFLSDASVW